MIRRLKLFLSTLGFCLALAGVARNASILVWVAIGALAGALALRAVERRQR